MGHKHTLPELRQDICKKIEGKSYAYPLSPPRTALRLKDTPGPPHALSH